MKYGGIEAAPKIPRNRLRERICSAIGQNAIFYANFLVALIRPNQVYIIEVHFVFHNQPEVPITFQFILFSHRAQNFIENF